MHYIARVWTVSRTKNNLYQPNKQTNCYLRLAFVVTG